MTQSFPSQAGLPARRCIVTGMVRTIAHGFLAWAMHAEIDVAILIVGAMPPKGWASPRVEAIQCQHHPCLMKGFHG